MPHDTSTRRDLRERLQTALGDAYTIERELGGAGMSRVFVALEVALERRVVVKVLPPDLAGMNVERFRREVSVAAQLQHPHIVPVHAAGALALDSSAGDDRGSVPYYTMPFIEGESLRTLLARDGPLPLGTVTRALHDVADALAYAHERGIVHRDIKPDNILLTGQHAVVLDFGIAKALRSAFGRGGHEAHDGGATGAGVAIGTPAYMAPEQAAADPGIDHRADIYAFGALAYELLAGRPPFTGRPPHELLAAHITEAPTPVAELRPDAPPALAALVMHCLEKRPADRPQQAAQVRDALDSIATPPVSTRASGAATVAGGARARGPLRARLRGAALAAAAAGAIAAAVALFFLWPVKPAVDDDVVAVAPFRMVGTDASLRYLREGMLDLLAAKLTGGGGPRSADPRALLSAWRRAAGSDTAALPRDRALQLAEGLGAGQLLLGEIGMVAGDRLMLRATLVRVRDGRAQAPAQVEGPADSLAQLVDQLTAQLLAVGAGEQERLSALTTTSLPALRAYLAGQSLYRHARYREAAEEFERATQLDSGFALAGIGLASASQWFGDPDALVRGLTIAWQPGARLSARDRALRDAKAGPHFPQPPMLADLLTAKLRYAEVAPDRPEAWFEAGDGLFHFGAATGTPDPDARAAAAFRRALALDSAFAPAIEHLLLLDARAGDTVSVRRLSALYLALDPRSENADGVRWRTAVALGDRAAVEALVRRSAELHPTSVHTIETVSQLDGVGLDDAERIVAGYGRSQRSGDAGAQRLAQLVSAHDRALNRGRVAEALALAGRYSPPGGSARLRTRVRDALYGDGDSTAAAQAVRELERSSSGPAATTGLQRNAQLADLCYVELWRLAQGDTQSVARSLAQLRAPRPPSAADSAFAPFAHDCTVTLEAIFASLARRPDAGAYVARLDSLARTGPFTGIAQQVGNLVVARLKEQAGDLPGALAAVRRREYFYGRVAYLSTFLREEGRLAALAGDREAAIEAYRHYVALRSAPDPVLRRDVDGVRSEIRRLEQESAGR
jgi:tetratricopeptide (TPR) repeat protein